MNALLRIGAAASLLASGCYAGLAPLDPAADDDDAADGSSDGGPDADDGAGDGWDGDPPPEQCDPDASPAGPTQLRRLSRVEYENTVRIVLGVDAEVVPAFLPDERPAGFTANLAHAGTTRSQEYQAAAIAISDAADLETLAGCPASDGTSCAETLVRMVGPGLFRRTLTEDEVQAYVGVFVGATQPDLNDGLATVLEAMLQSPHFIYHVELGAPDPETGTLTLTGPELANRIAYLLWSEPPDAELSDAGRSGSLLDRAVLETHVRRLMSDPRAEAFVGRFFVEWLDVDAQLDDKADLTEGLSAALAVSMETEMTRFVQRVLFEQGGSWRDLLLATSTEADATLSGLYDVAAPADGAWTEVAWDDSKRRGILSLPAVLTAQAGADSRVPVHQGRLALQQLLCTPVPSPPEGAVGQAPPKDPALTEREYSEQLIEIEGCGGCHGYIEPVGWIFGHYDLLGRWIDTEKGKPIDATGSVVSSGDPALAGEIDGVPELAERLADSDDFPRCMTQHAMSYVYARAYDGTIDACARDTALTTLEASDGDVVELIVALITSASFSTLQPMETQ